MLCRGGKEHRSLRNRSQAHWVRRAQSSPESIKEIIISPTDVPVLAVSNPLPSARPPLLRKFRSAPGPEGAEPQRGEPGAGAALRHSNSVCRARAPQPRAAPSHGLAGPPGEARAARLPRRAQQPESWMQGLHLCAALRRSLPQLQPPLNESAICYLSRPGGEVPVWSRLQPRSFNSLNTESHRLPRDSPGTGLRRGRGSTLQWPPLWAPFSLCVSRSVPWSLPVCLCLSLCHFLWLSLSRARARTHTRGRGFSPQPMPKCHRKSKCNNLLCKRPRSLSRNPLQWAALSSPARCTRGWGQGGGVNFAGGDDGDWCSPPLPLPGPCRNSKSVPTPGPRGQPRGPNARRGARRPQGAWDAQGGPGSAPQAAEGEGEADARAGGRGAEEPSPWSLHRREKRGPRGG